MKLGQNIKFCSNYILDVFENGSGLLKKVSAREWGIYPYIAIVKPC